MDHIIVTGIAATGWHGVFDHERRDGQTFVVDVDLGVDIATAAASDDLADTVDYGAVAAEVVAIIGGPPRDLIETVVTEIADRLLQHAGVLEVTVSLHKPEAPVGVPFDDVIVRVRRTTT